MTDFAIRPMLPAERAFVASSWVKSYASSDWARYCTPPPQWAQSQQGGVTYTAGHNRLVDALLDRPGVEVVVAEDESLVASWACCEGPETVHYVYTRRMYRGQGAARRLLSEFLDRACVFSHRSRELQANKLPAAWRFDPYAAYLVRGTNGEA